MDEERPGAGASAAVALVVVEFDHVGGGEAVPGKELLELGDGGAVAEEHAGSADPQRTASAQLDELDIPLWMVSDGPAVAHTPGLPSGRSREAIGSANLSYGWQSFGADSSSFNRCHAVLGTAQ